jgi:hypothetical protein
MSVHRSESQNYSHLGQQNRWPSNPAFLVALLKRSLNKYHVVLQTLNGIDESIVPVATAQAWRTEILAIRQEMIDAMGRFRQIE